jgi:hypothetical protein
MKTSELEIGKEYALCDTVVRDLTDDRYFPGWVSVQRVKVLATGVRYTMPRLASRGSEEKRGGVRVEIVADPRTAGRRSKRAFVYGHDDLVKSAPYFLLTWDEYVEQRERIDQAKDQARKRDQALQQRARKTINGLAGHGFDVMEEHGLVVMSVETAEEILARLRHLEASVPAGR